MEGLAHLKAAFTNLYPAISAEEWAFIANACEEHSVGAKAPIIEAGKRQHHIYFLTEGLVRGYYFNDKGEEINIHFINNQGWITHYAALLTDTPSRYTFRTLEASRYVALPYAVIQESYRRYKGLERFGRLIAERILMVQRDRIEQFQFLDAEQRYLAFLENHPDLYNRISLSHLSSYLGIQRQSLTRIRKKIASR